MKKLRQGINIAAREVFYIFLATYLLLMVAETVREGSVSNYFNINYLMAAVLVSGVAMVLSDSKETITRLRKRASRAVIVLSIRTYKRERAAALQRKQAMMAQQQAARARVSDVQPQLRATVQRERLRTRPVATMPRRLVSTDGIVIRKHR